MTEASRPTSSLGTSSYIVLGLLAQRGGGTSYDLKRWADDSVGYFWTFPRSQLYAEPQRLVSLGLLSEQQEENGRRKRVFQITDAGRAALREWLHTPAGFPELRDLGLLKLFFLLEKAGDETSPAVRTLAAEQAALHRERQATYRALVASNEENHPSFTQSVKLGLLYEEANVRFWEDLEENS